MQNLTYPYKHYEANPNISNVIEDYTLILNAKTDMSYLAVDAKTENQLVREKEMKEFILIFRYLFLLC